MSAQNASALDGAVLLLISRLQAYEDAMNILAETWFDVESYRVASDGIEAVRAIAASVPPLGMQWALLLVAHSEVVHELLRCNGDLACPAVSEARQRHAESVLSLRERCLRELRKLGGTVS